MSSNSRKSTINVIQKLHVRRDGPNEFDCRLCKKDHPLRTCRRFNNMNVTMRINTVKKYKYCQNCLAHSHTSAKCRSFGKCRLCRKTHHTLLHQHKIIERQRSVNTSPVFSLRQSAILRPTVIINLQLGERWGKVRGILNPSSEFSKIAEFLPTRYNLPIEKSGDRRICKLIFKPHFVDGPIFTIHALVTKDLPQLLRSSDLSEEISDPYKNLRLADPEFYKACDINVILGADVYPHIIKTSIHPPTLSTPMAQDTQLGWMLIGKIRI